MTSWSIEQAGVEIDGYVIMPNHIHLILNIEDGSTSIWSKQPARSIEPLIVSLKASCLEAVVSQRGTPNVALWMDGHTCRELGSSQESKRAKIYILHNAKHWEKDPLYRLD